MICHVVCVLHLIVLHSWYLSIRRLTGSFLEGQKQPSPTPCECSTVLDLVLCFAVGGTVLESKKVEKKDMKTKSQNHKITSGSHQERYDHLVFVL